MISVHSNKILTKTEVGTRDWGIAVIGLTMFLLGGMWIWGLQKAVELMWGLMGHPSMNVKDFVVAESDLYCADLAQEVSEEKDFSMWPRDCSCGILMKNVAAFCPYLKSLSEAKLKRFLSISLIKEVSRSPSKTLFSS